MKRKPNAVEINPNQMLAILEQIAEFYHTTAFEILLCYLYYLLDNNPPIGYPKKVVRKSEAEEWHYFDPNYLVVPDELEIVFPGFKK